VAVPSDDYNKVQGCDQCEFPTEGPNPGKAPGEPSTRRLNFYRNVARLFFHMATAARTPTTHPDPRADGALVTKATLRAAERLGLSNKELARILGLSESTVSRMGARAYALTPEQKPYELALLFVRLYRSLDSIVGGDQAVAKTWLRADNTALGGTPLARIMSVAGLAETIAYLDARRALA
jgi:hypothetical protein